MEVNIKVPQLVSARDYHDFDYCDVAKALIPKLKVVEIGFAGGVYWGLAYVGKRPSKKEVAELLKDKKITFDD